MSRFARRVRRSDKHRGAGSIAKRTPRGPIRSVRDFAWHRKLDRYALDRFPVLPATKEQARIAEATRAQPERKIIRPTLSEIDKIVPKLIIIPDK